jgi:hypothetical protein
MVGAIWAGRALQSVDVDIDPAGALGGGALGAALTTLVFGAILVALAPEYMTARMREVTEDPVDSFAWGVFIILALVVMSIALVITIVGILVVIPLLVTAYLVWGFGTAVAFAAIAERLLDRFGDDERDDRPEADGEQGDGEPDDWLTTLLVAGALDGALVLTGIGALLSLAIGAAGFGAIVRNWLS